VRVVTLCFLWGVLLITALLDFDRTLGASVTLIAFLAGSGVGLLYIFFFDSVFRDFEKKVIAKTIGRWSSKSG
jgi:hypothetical protein